MIIAVVGQASLTGKYKRVIKDEYPEVDILEMQYLHYTEAPKMVDEKQNSVDGIIFGGKLPYKLTEKEVVPKVPWTFMDREYEILYRAMLEASLSYSSDLKKLSIDTYEPHMIIPALEDIGLKEENLELYIANQNLLDENYEEYLTNFHVENYRYRNVSCCITGVTEVYKKLLEKNIPVVRTMASKNAILKAFHRVEKELNLIKAEENQIVVLEINVNLPQSYLLDEHNQYIYVCNRNKIEETLHLFAIKINATIVNSINGNTLMFTTHKSLMSGEVDIYELYLFDMLRDITIKNICMGIGYGKTVLEAQTNANIGVEETKKAGGNMAIIVYSKERKSSLIKLIQEETLEREKLTEDYALRISRRSGISINTVWKIYNGVKHFGNSEITTQALATVCGMSKRNMDRIILKLEKAGVCEVVMTRVKNNAGRPTRILRFRGFE